MNGVSGPDSEDYSPWADRKATQTKASPPPQAQSKLSDSYSNTLPVRKSVAPKSSYATSKGAAGPGWAPDALRPAAVVPPRGVLGGPRQHSGAPLRSPCWVLWLYLAPPLSVWHVEGSARLPSDQPVTGAQMGSAQEASVRHGTAPSAMAASSLHAQPHQGLRLRGPPAWQMGTPGPRPRELPQLRKGGSVAGSSPRRPGPSRP